MKQKITKSAKILKILLSRNSKIFLSKNENSNPNKKYLLIAGYFQLS